MITLYKKEITNILSYFAQRLYYNEQSHWLIRNIFIYIFT